MVMCQQSIEKVLKAIYVKNENEIPDKIHNLRKLAVDAGVIEECSEEVINLFNKLLVYYFGSRYPDKREKLKAEFTRENMESLLKQTKEVYLWLKSKL